jgi:uncharacterized membrane protein YfcA
VRRSTPWLKRMSISPKAGLFIALGVFFVVYLVGWAVYLGRARRRLTSDDPAVERGAPTAQHLAIGFITNFFDTLGIGSFATTTSMFRLRKVVPDRLIPGTLNVGHTAPTVVQAFIYISIIAADMTTLVAMIAAAVAGAWLGAGVVAGWSRRKVQIGMGGALLVAASLMLATQLGLFPVGGETIGVQGGRLGVGVGGNFALGALMTLGIGLYAPCMILVSLLGMSPKVAFPIMMGSCAFLMPVGSLRFIRKDAYSLRPALGLAIGGVPGVLLAAFIVKSLPLGAVRWLVIVVVVYTALALLRAAFEKPTPASTLTLSPPPPLPR